MQLLTILNPLREEMTQAEDAVCSAWDRYYHLISQETLYQAVETTKRIADLHRQMALRLEQIIGTP
jgi:hypothetical protein